MAEIKKYLIGDDALILPAKHTDEYELWCRWRDVEPHISDRAIALLERWLQVAHDLDLKVYPPLLEETRSAIAAQQQNGG